LIVLAARLTVVVSENGSFYLNSGFFLEKNSPFT
jgi:hypothetical protein